MTWYEALFAHTELAFTWTTIFLLHGSFVHAMVRSCVVSNSLHQTLYNWTIVRIKPPENENGKFYPTGTSPFPRRTESNFVESRSTTLGENMQLLKIYIYI